MFLFFFRQRNHFAVLFDTGGCSGPGNRDDRTTASCVGVRADPCKGQLRGRDVSILGELIDLVDQLEIFREVLGREVVSTKFGIRERGRRLLPVAESDQTYGECRPWEYLPVS